MPHVELSAHQVLLHRLREFAQAQEIRDGAARAADRLGGGIVGQAELVDQALNAVAPARADSGPRAGCSRSARAPAPTDRAPPSRARAPRQAPRAAPRASAVRRRRSRSGRRRPGARGSAASRLARESMRRARRAPRRPSACAAGTCRAGCGRAASVCSASAASGSSAPASSASRPRPSPFGRIIGASSVSVVTPPRRGVGRRARGASRLPSGAASRRRARDRPARPSSSGRAAAPATPCDGASASRMLRGIDRPIELVAEMLLELGGDVERERVARVVHRAQQALDLEPRVQVRAHFLHRLHEVGQSFERVVLALHRDQHRVRRAEAVEREQRQRRRAIEQDEVVVGRDRRDRRSHLLQRLGERVLQPRLALGQVDELDFGAGELAVRRHEVEAAGRRATRTSAILRSPSSTWYTVAASARLSMPAPVVALPCGSRSTSSTRRFIAARLAARLTAVVVLPTPPFWFATAMMRRHARLHHDQVARGVEPRHCERGVRDDAHVCRQARDLLVGIHALHRDEHAAGREMPRARLARTSRGRRRRAK